MSEYELATLFNDVHTTLVTHLATTFSVISAFLVVSHFVAHRLNWLLSILAVAFFCWFSFVQTILQYREMAIYRSLFGEIRKFREAGKGLDWHSAAQTPSLASDIIPVAGTVFNLIVFVAAVVFFFHSRHANRKEAAVKAKTVAA